MYAVSVNFIKTITKHTARSGPSWLFIKPLVAYKITGFVEIAG